MVSGLGLRKSTKGTSLPQRHLCDRLGFLATITHLHYLKDCWKKKEKKKALALEATKEMLGVKDHREIR